MSSQEERAAKAFAKAARDVSFNPHIFAVHLGNEAPEAQEKYLLAALTLTEGTCAKIANGSYHIAYQTAVFIGKAMGF